jgi:hypothetical protein
MQQLELFETKQYEPEILRMAINTFPPLYPKPADLILLLDEFDALMQEDLVKQIPAAVVKLQEMYNSLAEYVIIADESEEQPMCSTSFDLYLSKEFRSLSCLFTSDGHSIIRRYIPVVSRISALEHAFGTYATIDTMYYYIPNWPELAVDYIGKNRDETGIVHVPELIGYLVSMLPFSTVGDDNFYYCPMNHLRDNKVIGVNDGNGDRAYIYYGDVDEEDLRNYE